MCKIFKHNNLQITIEANLKKVVNFPDITLDLRTSIYQPYKKTNSNLTYKQSNHLPSIHKNLPKSINKSLSTNSQNAQVFNEACPPHKEAIKKNGYNTNLQFDMSSTRKKTMKRRKRERGKLLTSYLHPPPPPPPLAFNMNHLMSLST